MFKYIKENGIKRFLEVLYKYKIEIVLEKIVLFFTKQMNLKNIIVIESHNDFDSNGGAFYEYLINNNYNNKYKIVWQLRKKPKVKLPNNVTYVFLNKPSIRKAYFLCISKFLLYDCDIHDKIRSDQILVYCGHGAIGLKSTFGKLIIPASTDYILGTSERFSSIHLKSWTLSWPDNRVIFTGYPVHDYLYKKEHSEIKKITTEKYNKIILWMPTFRKGIAYKRNDSLKEQKLGIPLFDNLEDFNSLNDKLKEMKSLLIIKIHPKQDLNDLGITSLSNIIVLTGEDIKKLNVDNYKLMNCTDALISDYSSAAFDYLHTNKPIGYVLDDLKEFKTGFIIDDIHRILAGTEIYTYDDLIEFINNVLTENDEFVNKRKELCEYIFKFQDGKSCERLAKFLEL